jgi:hypothetical protein
MARLPVPGQDNGAWGDILNDYLAQSHKPNGNLKDNSVTSSVLAPGSVSSAALATDAVSSAALADGSVKAAALDTSLAPNINQVLSYDGAHLAWMTPTGGVPDATTSSKGKIQLAGDLAGTADAPTIASGAVSSTKLATAVQTSLGKADSAIQSVNGKTGSTVTLAQADIANLTSDLAAKAPLASPTFSGVVTVPAPSNGTDATTKTYVDGQVSGVATPDATSSVTGKVRLTGDFGGSATAPLVAKINSVAMPSNTPGNGNVLTATSATTSTWTTPAAGVTLSASASDIAPLGVQAAGSVGKAADAGHVHAMPRLDQVSSPTASVGLNSQKITGLANGTASSDAAAFGQIPLAGTTGSTYAAGNDTRITGAVQGSATPGGDLSGTYTTPTVAKVNGVAVNGTASHGKVIMATDGTTASWNTIPVILPYSMPGTVIVKTGALRQYVEAAYTITGVRASVGTAPTGSSIIVDVLLNGTTIYTTAANRPTIAVSTNTATGNSPNITALSANDYLTVNVAQVGSTVAGSDLSVSITLAYA